MAKVEKGNVVLRIKDSEVQRYIDMGYNHIDEGGNIIQESVPTDVATLRKAYIDHVKEIEDLKAEIVKLTTKPTKKAKDTTPTE